jgi:formimidoylglutamate deiminase
MQQVIWAAEALLPDGWAREVAVTVADGRIAAVAAGAPARGTRVACLLPAPVNLHSHAFQRAMAGLTEARGAGRDSFWTWRALMYRFLERIGPEDVEALAALQQMESAEAGFAAVAEFHYLHHAPGGAGYADPAEMAGRIAAAARLSGVGLTLLPVLYEVGGCDGRPLAGGQLRFGCDPDRFLALHAAAARHLDGDMTLGLAPHSLRAVTAAGLRALAAMPGATGPIHIHAAEQAAEVEEVLAFRGARPVEWLLDQAEIGPRWCLIHATQMLPGETLRLAQTGAVAGLCPVTEANLGDGLFDGVRFAQSGGRWGVGTDSNVRIDLCEELRLLEYGQRLRDGGRALLADAARSTGRALWEAAAAGGAQAAGRDAGAIRAGAWADLVAPAEAGDLEGLSGDRRLDALVFARGAVAEVWAAGRHIVRAGRHVARDRIEALARPVLRRLREAA